MHQLPTASNIALQAPALHVLLLPSASPPPPTPPPTSVPSPSVGSGGCEVDGDYDGDGDRAKYDGSNAEGSGVAHGDGDGDGDPESAPTVSMTASDQITDYASPVPPMDPPPNTCIKPLPVDCPPAV